MKRTDWLQCLAKNCDRFKFKTQKIQKNLNCALSSSVRLSSNYLGYYIISNRSQMTSKCGKDKTVAHEAIAECVTDVLTTVWCLLWSVTEQTHGNMESFLHFGKLVKLVKWLFEIPFDIIHCLYKMKQIYWLLYELTHSDSFGEITKLSNLNLALSSSMRLSFDRSQNQLKYAQSWVYEIKPFIKNCMDNAIQDFLLA